MNPLAVDTLRRQGVVRTEHEVSWEKTGCPASLSTRRSLRSTGGGNAPPVTETLTFSELRAGRGGGGA